MTATAKHSEPESNGAFTKNPNLGGFDDFAKSLVRRAIKAGWLARRSAKGHMLLYAPDGKTTTSISRDMSAPRVRENAEKPIKAWERKSKITLPEPVGGTYVCPNPAECGGYLTDKRMAMVSHLSNSHGPDRLCVLCDRKFGSTPAYSRHMRGHEDELQLSDTPALDVAPAEPVVATTDTASSLPVHVPAPVPSVLQVAAGPETAETDEAPAGFEAWSTVDLIARARENAEIMDILHRRLDDKLAHLDLAREALADLNL
ncbi:hypothetical protein GS982_20535 [Rhodococcus hoagii]|nr:hypothetical protein [Prescottella equi]NKZ84583.1 hypothetical protein [Prescottella equi]